jgi:hypothetical protein
MHVLSLAKLAAITDAVQSYVGYRKLLDWQVDTRHTPAVLRAEYEQHGQAKRLTVFMLPHALEVAVATFKQEDGRDTWPENLRTRLNYPA